MATHPRRARTDKPSSSQLVPAFYTARRPAVPPRGMFASTGSEFRLRHFYLVLVFSAHRQSSSRGVPQPQHGFCECAPRGMASHRGLHRVLGRPSAGTERYPLLLHALRGCLWNSECCCIQLLCFLLCLANRRITGQACSSVAGEQTPKAAENLSIFSRLENFCSPLPLHEECPFLGRFLGARDG